MTAIIVDDEQDGIDTLAYEIKRHCSSIKIIDTYQSSVEGLKGIKKYKPELLFLDIKMPHLNGLELLELAGPNEVNAIFTTAYEEFETQALRLNAIDYLIKPIDSELLKKAVAKVERYGSQRLLKEQIKNALDFLKTLEINYQTKIGIKAGQQTIFVPLLHISHCVADGNFTIVKLKDNKSIYSSYSLRKLEKILPESHFYRCHRTCLVNGEQIYAFDKSNGGQLIMNNQEKIPLSRSNREELMDFLAQFGGKNC